MRARRYALGREGDLDRQCRQQALQERPKSRSPNSRVRERHVTVTGRASWKHHGGVARCGGQVQVFGRIGQVVCKIDGQHRLDDRVQLWRRIIVSRALEGIKHVVGVIGFAVSLQLVDELYCFLAGRRLLLKLLG